jgi:hypothetical protein
VRALSSADFLNLWERGLRLHSLDQGLLTLGEAFPEASSDTLADWPLGRRNRTLVELRSSCFGPRLEGWVACPACAEKLEFDLDGRALVGLEASEDPIPSEPIVVKGHSFRVPTSRDLARVARDPDPGRGAIYLLESCRLDSAEAPVWSEEDLEEVGESMARADPLAEILLTLKCPACGSEWAEALDIAAFLWAEIEARAKRLLWEVHTLASSYGWSEREILLLSEHRRAHYLELVRA